MANIFNNSNILNNSNNSNNSNTKSKYQLDTFQTQACDFIDQGFNVLVSAPTGSGKTAIAEYAIEITKNKNDKIQIIYTCPIKSLCNEKYRDMTLSYSSINSTYTVGLMTGDIIINPDGDIIIMTTEVLYNLITNLESNLESNLETNLETNIEAKTKKEFNPGCIIFDEVHYINDDGRGHIWEKCIICSLKKYDSLLVLLSATIGNIDSLIHWLNSINEAKHFKKIIKTERPVPLREYFVDNSKIRKLKKKLDEEEIINITNDPAPEEYELLELNDYNYNKIKKYWIKLEEYGYSMNYELQTLCNQIASNPNLGIPAIIFVLSKTKCISYAEMCESSFVDHIEQSKILHFFDENLREFNTCSQYVNLRKTISKGIAYHHSGLIPKIREVVEFLIKNKLIKIVFATETFAVGLNFPVKTVVMTSLNKPSENGFRNFYVSEYKQMAGRAGRRFIDTVGNVIIWLYNDRPKNKNPYQSWSEINSIVAGPIDNVKSKFVIEPNFLLKNLNSFRIISQSSFKYYNTDNSKKEFIVPEKYIKLFDSDLKAIDFGKQGITFIDKNYKKLISKFTKDEQVEYKKILDSYRIQAIKTDFELYVDNETYMIDFLRLHNFVIKNNSIIKNNEGLVLTPKGELASYFNEINPIIFTEHKDYILSNRENIIPILSMFIDDGISSKDEEIDSSIFENQDINYFNTLVETRYYKFINLLPKWTFYPENYLLIKTWLNNPDITLDDIVKLHKVDMGLMVKILIKIYQITDELIIKLVKINRTDLTEFLAGKKELLIRYPIKLESLYTNN